MGKTATEFCYEENDYFPKTEFYDDPTWGRVHRTARPHTVLGDELSETGPAMPGMDMPGDPPPDPVSF